MDDFEQAQTEARIKKAAHYVTLRQGCNKTVEGVAAACSLSVEDIQAMERGDVEISPLYSQTVGMWCDCDEEHQG